MNHKADHVQLISYLCGELQGEEKRNFEKMLAGSPELAAELEEARQVMGSLHALPDMEAPQPVLFMEPPVSEQEQIPVRRPVSDRIFNRFTQAVLAVAASLTMLLVAGALTGTQVTVDGNGLSLRFGAGTAAPDSGTDNEEIKNMLAGMQKEMQAMRTEKAPDQAAQFYKELASLKGTLNELNRRVAAQAKEKDVQTVAGRPGRRLTEAQMNRLMAALSDENLRLIENAFQTATEQQQRQLQESLTSFARYLDQIRAEDTELVLASIEELDRKADVKFRETDQAIDALLQTVQTQDPR